MKVLPKDIDLFVEAKGEYTLRIKFSDSTEADLFKDKILGWQEKHD